MSASAPTPTPAPAPTDDDLRRHVLDALAAVAPESRGRALAPDEDLRDQLDLDSMDFLNVLIALHRALGVDIPETDAPRLATLDGAVAYLGAVLARG